MSTEAPAARSGTTRASTGVLPAAALAALGAWLALVLAAPPDSNLFWAVNGFRSIAPAARILVLAATVLAVGVALRPQSFALGGAALLGILLAVPFRERIHLLGDTQLRQRLLEAIAGRQEAIVNPSGFASVLHAGPLDGLYDVSGAGVLARLGVPVPDAVAVTCLLALIVFAVALWRIARRAAPGGGAIALATAALLAGTLQAFAGYADVWALALAAVACWWAALARPLDRPGRAAWNALAWLVLLLIHRAALLLLVAQMWRGLGPAFDGDRRETRRLHVVLSLVALAVGVGLGLLSGPSTFGREVSDFLSGTFGAHGPRLVRPWDLANLALLTFPLALAAPWLAGREAFASWRREPATALVGAALIPLVPMLAILPDAPHGLGAMRDWDLAALFGAIATFGAVALMGRAPAVRRRLALALVVPLFAVQSLSWVAVNADAGASERRAEALVEKPFGPRAEQRSQALVFLAYRATARDDYVLAARRFSRAADLFPDPRHPLLAAQCWVMAGDVDMARASYARAMTMGPLDPRTRATADEVQRMIGMVSGTVPHGMAEHGMSPHGATP